MKWTREVPTEPGFYFISCGDEHCGWCGGEVLVVQLLSSGEWMMGQEPEDLSYWTDPEFSGPIPIPPKESPNGD